jgi:RNA polymerase sigma factor (sigma-70 family)
VRRSDAVVVQASDRFLVAAAQVGDLHAFEALVRRHQGAAYRVALHMLGADVDAEDAAQEALVQAWRGPSTFRRESAFSTWPYRIVTNRCLTARAAGHPREALPDVLIDRDSDPAEALGQASGCMRWRVRCWCCRPGSAQRWSCVSWRGCPMSRSPRP